MFQHYGLKLPILDQNLTLR